MQCSHRRNKFLSGTYLLFSNVIAILWILKCFPHHSSYIVEHLRNFALKHYLLVIHDIPRSVSDFSLTQKTSQSLFGLLMFPNKAALLIKIINLVSFLHYSQIWPHYSTIYHHRCKDSSTVQVIDFLSAHINLNNWRHCKNITYGIGNKTFYFAVWNFEWSWTRITCTLLKFLYKNTDSFSFYIESGR